MKEELKSNQDEVFDASSENYDNHLKLGNYYFHLGDYNKALKYYLEALACSHDEHSIYRRIAIYDRIAMCFYFQGKHKKAEEYIKKALKLDPSVPDFHQTYALILIAQRRFVEAERECEKALSLDPEDEYSHFLFGVYYKEAGNYKMASKYFREALSLSPDRSFIYSEIADLYRLKGKFRKAEDYIKKSLSIDPNDAEAYNEFGIIRISQNKIKEGVKLFRKAVRLDPNKSLYRRYYKISSILSFLGPLVFLLRGVFKLLFYAFIAIIFSIIIIVPITESPLFIPFFIFHFIGEYYDYKQKKKEEEKEEEELDKLVEEVERGRSSNFT